MDSALALDPAQLRPRRAEGLHRAFVDGVPFAHNPRGFEALAVLSPAAAALLDHADGASLRELASLTGYPLAALYAELPLLAENGFVTGEHLPPARRPAPSPPSFDLWVHVTNACNLDCPHCYIEKDGASLDEATASALRGSLVASARAGVRAFNLRFAGGEPMLCWEFLKRFYDDTRALLAREGAALRASILTNGTRVPVDAARWVRDRGVGVSVSIDGVGRAHDAMRPFIGGDGSFDAVSEGIGRWIDGGVRPYALVTVSDDNLDAMPELTSWLLQRGLGFRYSLVRDLEGNGSLLNVRTAGWRSLVKLRRSRSAVREGAPPMLEGPALARAIRVFSECYDRIERALPHRVRFGATHRFCDLEWRRPIRKACGAGETSLAVSHDGRLSPCQAALHHEGTAELTDDTVLSRRVGSISQLGEFRRTAPDEGCARCAFRHSCAGGCPLMLHRRDGHLNGRSPYCELFRAVLPRILRVVAREILLDQRARSAAIAKG